MMALELQDKRIIDDTNKNMIRYLCLHYINNLKDKQFFDSLRLNNESNKQEIESDIDFLYQI
jgi:hypothetical protein